MPRTADGAPEPAPVHQQRPRHPDLVQQEDRDRHHEHREHVRAGREERARAEGAPDQLISVNVDHREAWLFGTGTTEVWYNAGTADFPLQRIQGAFNELGCAAVYSVAKLDNTLFWLGADARGRGIVYQATGYRGERISTHAVVCAPASVSDSTARSTFHAIARRTSSLSW